MVTITEDPDTTYGTCAGEYVVTRTFTAADDCGNEVTAVQTITIEDNTAPVFDPYMKTVVVECSDGDGDDINYLPITATDNCSNVTYEVQSVHVRRLLVDHHENVDRNGRMWQQHD